MKNFLKNNLVLKNQIINILLLFTISYIFTLLTLTMVDWKNFFFLFISPFVTLLNTLPLFLIMLLIYLIFSRLWISFFIGGGLCFFVNIINYYKIFLRGEPLTPADIALRAEATNVIVFSELKISFFIIMICFIFILANIVLFKMLKPLKTNIFLRLAGIVFAVGIFFLSYNTVYKDKNLYESFYIINGTKYSTVSLYNSRGFIYSFIYDYTQYDFKAPDGYNPEKAKTQLSKFAIGNNKGKNYPHIIAIMGEAFYDMDRIENIEFYKDKFPLTNFNRINEDSYSGRIITDVFGGGTANTEFSFLTGHSTFFIESKFVPYKSLIRRDTFSLARHLETLGYSTLAFHPGYNWFYNRQNVYQHFGFDEIHFKDSLDLSKVSTFHDGYVSDGDTMDYIIKTFEEHTQKNPEQPFFEFTVTIDNHGPYPKTDIGNDKILKRTGNMTDDEYYTINNYLYGLKRCDEALGKLYDYIKSSDEPIVFIYFADHLPFLGENYLGYKALDYNIAMDKGLDEYLNHYSTPYFIFSNDKARDLLKGNNVNKFSGTNPEISSNYLPTELLDYIGIDGGSYFNYIDSVKKVIPVITKRFCKENGTYIENKENNNEILDEYQNIQYFMMTDKNSLNK